MLWHHFQFNKVLSLHNWICDIIWFDHWCNVLVLCAGGSDVFVGLDTRRWTSSICDGFRCRLLPPALPSKVFCTVGCHMLHALIHDSVPMVNQISSKIFHIMVLFLIQGFYFMQIHLISDVTAFSDGAIRPWQRKRRGWWQSTTITSRTSSDPRRLDPNRTLFWGGVKKGGCKKQDWIHRSISIVNLTELFFCFSFA